MDSPLLYIGGKSKLSETIIKLISPHQTYCEVFCGAAWVFFRKEPSKYEIINDLDSDLVTFYRVLQNHLEEFLRQFKWVLSSREWFKDWQSQQASKGLTDIQRAARYYYVQRHSFNGRVKGPTFGVGVTKKPKINLLRIEEELSEVYFRLAGVTIENLKWQDMIARYDRDETFFYIDPPYYKCPYYKFNMNFPDFQELAQVLSNVKAKFILSINDVPEMRQLFSQFHIKAATVKYITSGKVKEGKELLISNTAMKN